MRIKRSLFFYIVCKGLYIEYGGGWAGGFLWGS